MSKLKAKLQCGTIRGQVLEYCLMLRCNLVVIVTDYYSL